MGLKPQDIASYGSLFGRLSNIYNVLLFISGILIFDALGIMVFREGILDIDFSNFFELSKIPFFLLFLAVFGLISSGVSPLAFFCVFQTANFFYKGSEKAEDMHNIGILSKIALSTENKFLFKYLNREAGIINNQKKNSRIAYSSLLSIILDFAATLIYNGNTILKFIFRIYKNKDGNLMPILSTVLLMPVIAAITGGIIYSVSNAQFRIYFPKSGYDKLLENKEFPPDKKTESPMR
jgi:hypothetical protein